MGIRIWTCCFNVYFERESLSRFQLRTIAPANKLYLIYMENFPLNNSERRENIIPELEIISDKELVDRIYQKKNLPQDNRFLPVDQGGVFKYFHLEDIIGANSYSETKKLYPNVSLGNEIVGLAELEEDPRNKANYWIKFISVDPKYQGKGYATLLINKIFEYAKENNYSLEPSFYSDEGEDAVPTEVVSACCELAFKAAFGDLSPDISRMTRREKVDVIEVEYEPGAAAFVRYRSIDNLLAPLLSAAGSTVALVRA